LLGKNNTADIYRHVVLGIKKMPDLLGWDSTGHAPVVPGDKKFSIPGAMADSCIARGMLRDTQWAWPKTSIKIKDSNLWPF
jgi:hypothetical protein